MIVNNLMLKLKNRDDETIRKVKEELLSMRGNVDVLKGIKVEQNVREGEVNYDLLVTTEFESMEDFDAYTVHPFHVKVSENIGSYIQEIAAVCFKTS